MRPAQHKRAVGIANNLSAEEHSGSKSFSFSFHVQTASLVSNIGG